MTLLSSSGPCVAALLNARYLCLLKSIVLYSFRKLYLRVPALRFLWTGNIDINCYFFGIFDRVFYVAALIEEIRECLLTRLLYSNHLPIQMR